MLKRGRVCEQLTGSLRILVRVSYGLLMEFSEHCNSIRKLGPIHLREGCKNGWNNNSCNEGEC